VELEANAVELVDEEPIDEELAAVADVHGVLGRCRATQRSEENWKQ
jgi:hypothetical protein